MVLGLDFVIAVDMLHCAAANAEAVILQKA